jgi:hypothetical protein
MTLNTSRQHRTGIVNVKDQRYGTDLHTPPQHSVLGNRTGKLTRMEPTKGSKTQKRKANKANHTPGRK